MEKEGIVVETLKPVGTSTNKLWGESELKRKKNEDWKSGCFHVVHFDGCLSNMVSNFTCTPHYTEDGHAH